ncbi:MAG: VOC family protein [Polyangiaceae bacterium]|nr:VOC family protein [Polyangiaceae bacterium]
MSREGFDNVGALHHVEINVSDLKRSCEFWGWLLGELGYEPFQRWDEGASWKLGATYLVFVQTVDRYKDHGYHRRATGLNHIAFHARSKEHVDAITAELNRRGYTVLYRDQHPHAGGEDHYAVFFEDPDRIKVELAAPSNDS